MDDIIIHETNDKSNIKMIKKVLGQLIKHHIKLKPEKCSFLQKSVKFLGYKISGNGLEIDESRIRCIKLYPRPTRKCNVSAVLLTFTANGFSTSQKQQNHYITYAKKKLSSNGMLDARMLS